MCTITTDGVNVCRKTMLKQCFRDGLVAIQVGVIWVCRVMEERRYLVSMYLRHP
jgi:hypothetical protein